MTPTPSVSVIIPCYNTERYIAEAIESVLAQTTPPLQVIVVDDGSTDKSAEIVERFDSRVELLRQPNLGCAVARNLGVEAARGEYLGFLDADDLWTPEKLSVQLAAFREDPELELVFGHMEQFVSPDLDPAKAEKLVCPEGPMPSTLIDAVLVRADAFRRVGPMTTESGACFVDWYLRARDAGLKIHMVRDLVARRRLHDKNMSIVEKDVRGDYLKFIKASLDRRRAKTGAAGEKQGEICKE